MSKKKNETHFVVKNLIKLMNDRDLNKTKFAELIDFKEPKWNKISNGNQSLSVDEISKIAEKLDMREIDLFTYPDKFYEPKNTNNDVKAQITVELKEELKHRVLELVFGNSNLELLTKKE
ncbi:MAG: helix-turn-helix transcriptional regulator [Lentimicrobiaceae bacterium]|nr:helix-turn-helix transcriptional regulator [Lentimicrobiaceae bacterium]